MLTRRNVLAAAAGVALAPGSALSSDDYPAKPITLIVPYPPGGSTDIIGRIIGQKLSASLGHSVIIDNRPGGGGNIGMDAAARAAPDGYTLGVATTAHAINMTLFKNLGYDTLKSFEPVALLTETPLIVVVHPSVKANTIKELIALAAAKPGGLNFASSGNGQSTHLSAELFNVMAGVKMTHIPYKGSAPAINDLVGGQTNVMFDTIISALPFVKGDRLRALAVTSRERSPAAPDVPTIAETLPGYEAIAWNGLVAPKGTPKSVIDRLNAEVVKALSLSDVKERFEALGATYRPSTPEAFRAYVANEIEKWGKVVKQSGATVD